MQNVVSLGPSCFGSYLLKKQGLKKFSGPFDWLASSESVMIQLLESNFSEFLNHTKLCDHASNDVSRAGHTDYGSQLFYHFNPRNEKEYDYYVRCVDRFRALQHEKTLYVFHTRDAKSIDYKRILKSLGEHATLMWVNHTISEEIHCELAEKQANFIHIEMHIQTQWHWHLSFNDVKEREAFDEVFYSQVSFNLKEYPSRNGDVFYETRNVHDMTL